MKAKVKELTARSNALGYEKLKLKLKQFITGWVNYFKLADMKKILQTTDEWLRRRLRMYIWKRWKKIRTRYAMLKKLGLNHDTALKFACTRKGYWRIANSQILKVHCYRCPIEANGIFIFLGLLQSCSGVNLGSAVYRTVRTVL